MIVKKNGMYITERTSVPMMEICKSIGNGHEVSEIKNMYPINNDDIIDCIQFFCKYTEFDPFTMMTFKKIDFKDSSLTVKVQEMSAEFYIRMLNRAVYQSKKITTFDKMLVDGMRLSFETACKLITRHITEAEALNPVLDKALASEIEMFLQMTNRNALAELSKLDIDNFENNSFKLIDSD